MTLKQLRSALAALDTKYDDCRVVVWLPGSRIDLGSAFMNEGLLPYVDAHFFEAEGTGSVLLIEGNVQPGSALSSE